MDYTHTWTITKSRNELTLRDEALFQTAYSVCKKIAAHYREFIRGRAGYGQPIITDEEIMFNGKADCGQTGEIFHLKGSLSKNYQIYWCRTGSPNHSYDKVIVLCLWTLARICPFIRFDSDGGEEVTLADYTGELREIGIFI